MRKVTVMLSTMESHRDVDPATAAGQLATLRGDRAALAGRAVQPWWYDAALGLLVFVLVGAGSLHSPVAQVAADAVAVAGGLAAKRAYTRCTGFWVNGFRRGRTRRVVGVWLGLVVVVYGLAAGAEFGLALRGALAVGGAVLGVAMALLSRWWTRTYVAELREGA
jgi:hypothetical protein